MGFIVDFRDEFMQQYEEEQKKKLSTCFWSKTCQRFQKRPWSGAIGMTSLKVKSGIHTIILPDPLFHA